MSYIGQTSDSINMRFNNHKSDIRHFKINKEEQEIEIRHFNKHGIENIELSILKIVPNKKERLLCENDMMIKYGTVYPYGLNVMFKGANVTKKLRKSILDVSIYGSLFQPLTYVGCKQKAFKLVDTNFENLDNIESPILKCDYTSMVKNIKHIIFNVKKRFLGELLNTLFMEKSNLNMDIALDILRFRVSSQHLEDYLKLGKTNNNLENKIYFVMDYIENKKYGVNINGILNKYNNLLPDKNIKIIRAFRYDKPLGRVLFNYNGFAKEIGKNSESIVCNCQDLTYRDYVDANFGHVLTGNLSIISNSNLREYMSYGTKFRLKILNTKSFLKKRLSDNVDMFVQKLTKKYGLPEAIFAEWKYNIVKELSSIFNRKTEGISLDSYKILKEAIKDLQNKFIITYVDKANTNYAIICKKLYRHQLRNSYDDKNNYNVLSATIREVENRISAFYKKLKYKQCNKNLPYLVIVPKFHKNPVSFRTITCGYSSYLEIANKKFLNILKCNFEAALKINYTCIIKNSSELLKRLRNLNSIKELYVFDFEDLYNRIDLIDLKIKILDFFKRFNVMGTNIDHFNNLFNFVVNENFLFDGKNIFQQIRGVPMGGSCSSILADIYLYLHELNENLNKDFLCFRYIDDILFVRIKDSNDKLILNNYPKDLTLKSASEEIYCVNYLDLTLKIESNKLITKLYDKKNYYNFDTIKLLHFKSNVHISIFRNIYINNLTRIDSLNSNQDDIVAEMVKLYREAELQSYPVQMLNRLTGDFVDKKVYGKTVLLAIKRPRQEV